MKFTSFTQFNAIVVCDKSLPASYGFGVGKKMPGLHGKIDKCGTQDTRI